MQKNKAFFFDRDGVINYRIVDSYVTNTEELHIFDEVYDVLKKIKDLGYLLVLITNQQGIGKGIYDHDELLIVHNHLQENIFNRTGIMFDLIEYCPDLAHTKSKRRKPEPGMILDAAEKLHISLEDSWMVGDSVKDTIAGKKAACRTVFISNEAKPPSADYVFTNLTDMIEYLLENELIR
jgi:D-glycero-D-manno-heptose 1,7-bisphosphate phosphatase